MKGGPLFISSMVYQLLRDPADLLNKASMRLRGQSAGKRVTFAPIGGTREDDFRVPIIPSSGSLAGERVLHALTNSYPFSKGGYAHRSHEILRALIAEDFAASAITRLAYPAVIGVWPRSTASKIENVEYARSLPLLHPLSFRKTMAAQAEQIAAEGERKGAGILHTTTPWPNAVATSMAAERLGVPWVYEVRGEPESTWAAAQSDPELALRSSFYRASRDKETEAMHAAAAVIALSDVSKCDLELRGIGDVNVLPNAVRKEEVRKSLSPKSARSKLGLGDGPYIGSVSSIVDYEGFDDLIRALQYLPKEVKLLLVGEGSAVPRLKETAAECGVRERVIFPGWQSPETIVDWYSALDVFVTPRKDTRVTRVVTPMKMQRAQSFGIPVVCSDLPALREVTSGKAIYVPPEDPRGIAEGVRKGLASRNGGESHDRILTWEEVSLRLVRLYQSI